MEKILNYQEIDKKMRAIDLMLANSEERKKLLSLKQYLLSAEELANSLEGRANDLATKYEKIKSSFVEEQKKVDEYQRLSQIETGLDELKYLEKKVTQLFDSISAKENELAFIISEMEEVAKSFTEMRKKFDQSKKEYATYKEKYDALKLSKAGEIAEIKKELAVAAKGIPEDIMKIYLEKKSAKIFPVFVSLNGDYCGGCSTEIPLNQKNNIQNQQYIECENCRRLNFLAK